MFRKATRVARGSALTYLTSSAASSCATEGAILGWDVLIGLPGCGGVKNHSTPTSAIRLNS